MIFIGIVGFGKPAASEPGKPSRIDRDHFFAKKTHQSYGVNMMIMGDSRVLKGVSPRAMKAELGGLRILNFAYPSAGLNSLMFREAERRLDGGSPKRTIVLSVSPHSLTTVAARNEDFLEELNRPREQISERLYLHRCLSFFAPVSIDAIIKGFRDGRRGNRNRQGDEYFHKDGWQARTRSSPNPRGALKRYRGIFENNKVSSELVDSLLRQTQKWTEANIHIFGFRPPTPVEMELVENERSGLDMASFVLRFESAGGVWLEMPKEKYQTYDGGHLARESAVDFSADLAQEIKNHLDSAQRDR